MLFKYSYERAFNVELKLDKLEKNISKMSDCKKNEVDKLINTVSSWYISRINGLNNDDLLVYASLEKKKLLDYLNINGLFNILNDNKINNKFKDDDSFRREILYASQFKILSVLGKSKGPEYLLIFEKIFNFNYETSVRYASYDTGIYGSEYIKFIDTYLRLGGSKDVYVFKDYYSGDENKKYNMEELSTIINEIRDYKNLQKQKKIDF